MTSPYPPPSYPQQPYPQQPYPPPYYPQQAHPQQAYPQPAGGRLLVMSSYLRMAFVFALTGPTIEVNGHPIRAKWGAWPVDLPAGDYLVRVSTRYLGSFGPAQLRVTVYPGRQVTVYYRPPATIGMGGSIGFVPQKTRGIALMIVLTALAASLGVISVFIR